MKKWYVNSSTRTFVAGSKYRFDDLGCLTSIFDALQYMADTGGSLWEVELMGELSQGDIFWKAEETKFLNLYDLRQVKQYIGEYVIENLITFLEHQLIDMEEIKIKDPAAVPLLYKDQLIDTVSNLHRIIYYSLKTIHVHSGPVVEKGFKVHWAEKLSKHIKLSIPIKSIAI